jgi:hypothetical protein
LNGTERPDWPDDETIPKIMGKMLFADWKEWATRRPEWAGGDMGADFEKFVERKWWDALNVAAAEPQGWEVSGSKPDKGSTEKPARRSQHGEGY